MDGRELKIKCTARPGMFDGEWIVTIDVADDSGTKKMEFVADSSGVHLEGDATEADTHGILRVWKVDRTGGGYRVLVPGSGGSDSRFVDIPEDLVVA